MELLASIIGVLGILVAAWTSYYYFRKKEQDKFSENLFLEYKGITQEFTQIIKDLLPLSFSPSNYTDEQLNKIREDLSYFYFKYYLILPQKVLEEIYCLHACLYHKGRCGFTVEHKIGTKPTLRKLKSIEEKKQFMKNATIIMRSDENVLIRFYMQHKDRIPDSIIKCQARNVITAFHDCWNIQNLYSWRHQLAKKTIAQIEKENNKTN